MTGVGDGSRSHTSGRPWLAIGFFLAAGATFALVFTDDLRWLRLGILAALWAALVGSFVAMRYRRQMVAKESAAARAQEIYELELEREIAARREFEWEVEAQTRQRIEEDSREEIEALRAEVMALRENLQALFGGEVLWERVALTAQSTRMRALSEEPRLTTGEPNRSARPQIPLDVASSEVVEQPTELIGHIGDRDATAAQARPDPSAAPAEPAQHTERPTRRVAPGRSGGVTMARASAGADRARAERATEAPAGRQDEVPRYEQQSAGGPADHTGPTTAERARPEQRSRSRAAPPSETPHPPQRDQTPGSPPPHPPRSPDHEQRQREPTKPAMDGVPRGRPASAVTPPVRESAVQPPPSGTGRAPIPAGSFEDDWTSNPESSGKASELPYAPAAATSRMREQEPGGAEQPSLPEPASPPQSQVRGGTGRPGRRSRRTESESGFAAPESPRGATSRSRAADEPVDDSQVGSGTSGPTATGRRRAARLAEESAESSGAHSTGRSVSELLAAYGMSTSTPRRRRRAED